MVSIEEMVPVALRVEHAVRRSGRRDGRDGRDGRDRQTTTTTRRTTRRTTEDDAKARGDEFF